MKLNMPSDVQLIAGGVVLAALAVWWVTRKGNAAAVGSGVAGFAGEAVSGAFRVAPEAVGNAAKEFKDWAVSEQNPLEPLGTWIGGAVYDLTH